MSSLKTTTDWDATTYDRLADPQEEWARGVLERLPLEGDETVLDAGCGSGRVTRLLLERLPRGRVIGVDGSESMIATARDSLAEHSARIDFINGDLLELTPEVLRAETGFDAVDAVFSNATFHWIADHGELFARLFALLRPGTPLVAQCGGSGNVAVWVEAVRRASSRQPFAPHVEGFLPWSFYGPDETGKRLRAAGFERVSCWLEERIVRPEDPRDYVAVSGLASFRERLPDELGEPFIDAVMDELPEPLELRYVRLNIDARRPAR